MNNLLLKEPNAEYNGVKDNMSDTQHKCCQAVSRAFLEKCSPEVMLRGS